MSRITFTFDGLCAFFMGRVQDASDPQLTVGLIDVSRFPDVPEEDMHHPRITIRVAGTSHTIRDYRNFRNKTEMLYEPTEPGRISGEIRFDVHFAAEKLKPYDPAPGEPPPDDRMPADNILDIPSALYPEMSLMADPMKCGARLHFRNGLLYTLKTGNYPFADLKKMSEPAPPSVTSGKDAAIKAGLEVTIPDGGYAVLRFDSRTEDFIFRNGMDYEVAVSNNPRPESAEENAHAVDKRTTHFKYYYKLLDAPPDPLLVPNPDLDSLETHGGTPFCIIGGY